MSRVFINNTTSIATVTAAASINNLTLRTAMVWVKLTSYGNQNDMAWLGRGSGTFFDVSKAATFASLYAGIGWNITGAFSQDATLEDLPLNQWSHLAITHSTTGDKKIHIFLNGVEIASYASQVTGNATLTSDSLNNLAIGGYPGGGNSFTIDGKLYDFRLYNSILTAAQIHAIMVNGHGYDPAPASNKCQLTFFANTSPEVDASGNANNATFTGTTFSTDNPSASILSQVTSSVPFTDPQGNAVASGVLILDLSEHATVTSGGGQVAPMRVAIVLDTNGKIPVNTELFANDDLTPSGTGYFAKLYNYNMALVADFGAWVISGTSPIDLSQEVSTSLNVSYPKPFLVDENNTVTGNNSFTGTNTFSSLVVNGTPTGTGIITTTFKKGTGGGNYSTPADTNYHDVDSTNLSYTVVIPTGWKLIISASGSMFQSTAAGTMGVALLDTSVIVARTINPQTTNEFVVFHLGWVINGDGASHTVKLQFKTFTGADAANMENSSASLLPTMVFILTPSN